MTQGERTVWLALGLQASDLIVIQWVALCSLFGLDRRASLESAERQLASWWPLVGRFGWLAELVSWLAS